MKITNLHHTMTDRLKSNFSKNNRHKLARFLPSIAHMSTNAVNGDVTYLVAYRVWRGKTLPTKELVHSGAVGHPWYEGWSGSAFDGTAFMIIRVSKDGRVIRVVRDVIHNSGNWKMDTRLLHIKDNQYHVTFNTFGRLNPLKRPEDYAQMNDMIRPACFYFMDDRTKIVQHNPTRKYLTNEQRLPYEQVNKYLGQDCTFQNKAILTINEKTLKPTFTNTTLVCAQHHGRVEKNHAMFYDDKRNLAYQYAITPWTFFDAKCKRHTPMRTTLFKRVSEFYDPVHSTFNKHIQFSCSAPLIRYSNTELLGVGHFKIHYNMVNELPARSPARLFMNNLKKELNIASYNYNKYGHKIHYELVYGMFLYTVNRQTLKLQRASKSFILLSKRHPKGLCYPSGVIEHNSDTFFVTYHENDINIKLWTVTRQEIEKLLVLTNESSADTYPFEIITY